MAGGDADGDPDDEAPGWDVLDSVTAAHGLINSLHFGVALIPDQDGAYAINAYRATGTWVLLTYGLTELFVKSSDNAAVSGWGFELTMRVPRHDDDQPPPTWALQLLVKLARYVDESGRPFADGHRLSPGGPITGRPDTRLSAVAFASDPVLPIVTGPFGAVQFLTVIGITDDELGVMKQTSTDDVLRQLRAGNPELVTDPAR